MSPRRLLAMVMVALATAATPSEVFAQERSDGALAVWHPVLADSVKRLSSESASWRTALEAAAATGRRVFLITPDKLADPFESSTLAEAFPISHDSIHVQDVVVVINLDLLQRLSGLPMKAIDFRDDVDRIVAHEVYGHAIPYLMAGTLAEGKCADPAVGQSAVASCAVQRENVIRREMGLGTRFEYGVDSLAAASRYRQQ